jgi:hypothetical protein
MRTVVSQESNLRRAGIAVGESGFHPLHQSLFDGIAFLDATSL